MFSEKHKLIIVFITRNVESILDVFSLPLLDAVRRTMDFSSILFGLLSGCCGELLPYVYHLKISTLKVSPALPYRGRRLMQHFHVMHATEGSRSSEPEVPLLTHPFFRFSKSCHISSCSNDMKCPYGDPLNFAYGVRPKLTVSYQKSASR